MLEPAGRTLFATVEGGDFVELAVGSHAYIADVKEEVAKKLEIKGVPLHAITLHLQKDGGVLEALDVTDTLAEMLERHKMEVDKKIRIVAKLADAAALTVAKGAAGRSVLDLTALAEDHDISRVVAAIRSGKVTVRAGGHLLLPEDLTWPNATNNLLFVREFYAPLFDSVLNKCLPVARGGNKARQRRIVTGQPGIGKSVWSWYVIYRILTEQPTRTVIFVAGADEEVYVIPPDGPVRNIKTTDMSLAHFNTMRGLGKDPLLIADSVLPPVLSIPTLVVSSPGRLASRDLRDKLNSYWDVWHYMPIPSEEELLRLKQAAFPHLDDAGVELRMKLWGAIPRHVLVKVDPEQQRALGQGREARSADCPLEREGHGEGLVQGMSSMRHTASCTSELLVRTRSPRPLLWTTPKQRSSCAARS